MTFKKVTTNTLYQALGKGVQIATVLVTTGILTRSLGSAQFGQYKLLLTLMLLFASLSDWGTGFIGTREAAKHPGRQPQIFSSLLIFRFFFALIAGILLILISLGLLDIPIHLIFLTSLLLPLTSIRTSCQIIFQARLKMINLAIAEIVASLSFLFLILFTLSFSALTLSTVLLLLVLAAFLTDLTSIYLILRLRIFVSHPEHSEGSSVSVKHFLRFIARFFTPLRSVQNDQQTFDLTPLLKESLPMGALLVTFSVYNKLDILLLRHFQGDQAVGFYSLAYSIHDNLVMGAAFFMNSVFPILSRQTTNPHHCEEELLSSTINNATTRQSRSNKSTTLLPKTFTTSFHLLLITGLLVSLIFFITAPVVIHLLGGSEFTPSIIALQILTLATFFAYLNHATGFTLVALGKQSISLKIALAALAFNLIANYLFIPHFSFLASSVITILTEALVFLLTARYLLTHTQLRLHLSRLPQTLRLLISNRHQLF